MAKKLPTIPAPPVFQEKTPVIQGAYIRTPGSSRQWLLFSGLLLLGVIVLGYVSFASLGWLKNVKFSLNAAPTPVPIHTFSVQRTAVYAGLEFTVVNVQYANSFTDDIIQSGPTIVRLNMKVTNKSSDQISVIYYDIARLIAPKLDPIKPTNVSLSVGPKGGTSEKGWIDFSVPSRLQLDTLKLQLGSSLLGEYLVTIPFSGTFHPEVYDDRTSPQSLDIDYYNHNDPLLLYYHLSSIDIRYSYHGTQARAGQQFYVLNFSVSNPNGVQAKTGYGYDYVRASFNGGPFHPPVDSTFPYGYNAGAKGVNGRVVFTGPAGVGSITIEFLVQYGSGGSQYTVSL